jgi:S-adenosylmethionine decarboxylase
MEEINLFREKIKKFKFIKSKIYPKSLEHEYVVLDKDIDFFREFINEFGIDLRFFRTHYKYVFIDNYKYWIIDEVLNREYNFHFGEHITLDCYGCDYEGLMSKEKIIDFLNKSVETLGMKKLGEPVIYYAEPKIKDPGGYSAFVVIEESHISIHTFGKRKFCTIDFYSCKEAIIYKNILMKMVKDFFGCKNFEINYLIRGKKYPEKNLI